MADETPTTETNQNEIVAVNPELDAAIARDFGYDRDWVVAAQRQIAFLQKNDLLPPRMTPSQCLAVLMRGKTMGITSSEALATFYPYQGKLGTYAQGAAMLAQQRGAKIIWTPGKTHLPEAEVTITTERGDSGTFSFSMEDAKRANLAGKSGTWQTSPQDMLCNRALMRGLRLTYPLLFGSAYLPDEIDEMEQPYEVPAELPEAVAPEAQLRRPDSIGSDLAATLLEWSDRGGVRRQFVEWIARQFPKTELKNVPASRLPEIEAWLSEKTPEAPEPADDFEPPEDEVPPPSEPAPTPTGSEEARNFAVCRRMGEIGMPNQQMIAHLKKVGLPVSGVTAIRGEALIEAERYVEEKADEKRVAQLQAEAEQWAAEHPDGDPFADLSEEAQSTPEARAAADAGTLFPPNAGTNPRASLGGQQ